VSGKQHLLAITGPAFNIKTGKYCLRGRVRKEGHDLLSIRGESSEPQGRDQEQILLVKDK